MNPGWDAPLAEARIARLELDASQRAGELSGGQRAQLALTLAIAKRPEVLLLDEPVASLDPLARREFLQALMEITAEHGVSVVLSSHLVADLERVCDYLILLAAARVQLAGGVDDLLASHRRLTGPRRDPRQSTDHRGEPHRSPKHVARAHRSAGLCPRVDRGGGGRRRGSGARIHGSGRFTLLAAPVLTGMF